MLVHSPLVVGHLELVVRSLRLVFLRWVRLLDSAMQSVIQKLSGPRKSSHPQKPPQIQLQTEDQLLGPLSVRLFRSLHKRIERTHNLMIRSYRFDKEFSEGFSEV